tara:strand:+ start:297 stop:1400 length:1104 start_codon:yes stop_codon:yes gene_type:complete
MNTPQNITVKSLVIGDVSKRSLGLDTINNTLDLDKPISTAQQTAIDLKADQATTYTKVEVDVAISSLIANAPGALDTLNELAAALGDDENFSTNITNIISNTNENIVAANVAIEANEDDISSLHITTATNSFNISNVKEYPYTTDIDNGFGSIKNVITTSGTSGYNGDIGLTSICFGSNCTTVGDNTFSNSTNLSEVIFNDSVTGTIGNNCFQNCSSYQNFSLSLNISALGNNCYRACTSLVTVDLAQYDIGTVGTFAFEGCTALTSFDFPSLTGNTQNPFTVIPESVLRNCTALTTIDIPYQITEINAAAFRDCTLLSTVNCYAVAAPTLTGTNQFLDTAATTINVPTNATGYSTTYGGLTVNPSL